MVSAHARVNQKRGKLAETVAELSERGTSPLLLCGDWNAQLHLLGDTRDDAKGRSLAETFTDYDFVVANNGSPISTALLHLILPSMSQ